MPGVQIGRALCAAAVIGVLFVPLWTRVRAGGPHPSWHTTARAGALDLLGVDLVDAGHGWAVGDIDPAGTGGAVLATIDGGRHWRPIASRSEVLTSVHFVNATTGWVAGYGGRIQRSDDGGRTWRDQRPERGRDVFNSVWAVDDRHAWAVGAAGLIVFTSDGEHWTTVSSPSRADLWAVRFISRERGWIAGESGTLLSTADGGATWSQLRSPTGRSLYGLAITSSGIGVAVGDDGVMVRSDDGSAWLSVDVPPGPTLYAVASTANGRFRVVGNGVRYESDDGGRAWRQAEAPAAGPMSGIAIVDDGHGVAVGARGLVEYVR